MSPLLPYVAGTLEIGLVLAGLALLWRMVLSPAARADRRPALLPRWEVSFTDFLSFLLLVLGGSFLAAAGAGYASRFLGLRGDAVTVASGAAAQLGMLGGVAAYRLGFDRRPFRPGVIPAEIFTTGIATFLISLPLLIATAGAWEFILDRFGLSTGRQDLIGMFAHADSPWLLAVMITLAIAIAPLTEELVFRAGLFRFLRTRLPRWSALLLPALVFAALHVNWSTLQGLVSLAPLMMLAVVFSLAYERTGRIGTSIVAHACFNLNTILVLFSGLNP